MSDTHNRPPGTDTGLSRRSFLKGTSLAAVGSALAQAPTHAFADDAKAGEVVQFGPGPVRIELTVNGQKMSTDIEPRTTLLDTLRDYLDVTGCKKVCDRASCGACTVMVDGKAIYSCSTLALEARGKEIETAESLYKDEKLTDVPAAFVDADAQQCGFCTPGFVVAMHATLKANPDATPEEVERGVSGNICRCGTYAQMRDAIHSLCDKMKKGGE